MITKLTATDMKLLKKDRLKRKIKRIGQAIYAISVFPVFVISTPMAFCCGGKPEVIDLWKGYFDFVATSFSVKYRTKKWLEEMNESERQKWFGKKWLRAMKESERTEKLR